MIALNNILEILPILPLIFTRKRQQVKNLAFEALWLRKGSNSSDM